MRQRLDSTRIRRCSALQAFVRTAHRGNAAGIPHRQRCPSAENAAIAEPVTPAEFAAAMAACGPFGTVPALAAAVSGGPHSLALALLAQDWARGRGGSLLALVVDHGLRPESAAEATHAARLLAARGIAARILPLGLPLGPRLQERARAARYAALQRAAAEAGRPWLLLGHHQADQAETLLFRASRGSGPEGLAAMPRVRAVPEALILRPLLEFPPARLEATVAAAGLAPIRDPSNENPRFHRIRLRQALGGDAAGIAALAAAAAAFGRRRARTEAAIAARLADTAILHAEGFARLDLAALGRDAIATAAFAALIRLIAGADWPPGPDAAAALLARGYGTLGGAWLRHGLLLRDPAAIGPPVPAKPGALWDRRFRLARPGDETSPHALPPASAAPAEAATHIIAALADDAPRLRPRAPQLPAAVLRALPAIRTQDGALAACPALLYPSPEACAPFPILFAPAAGPPAGWREAAAPDLGGDAHSTDVNPSLCKRRGPPSDLPGADEETDRDT